MDNPAPTREILPGGTPLWQNRYHAFGTDAFLLAEFTRTHRHDRVCDLCAGNGIVGVLLLEGKYPPSRVTAVELQPEAVALMHRTLAENPGMEEKLIPVEADLCRPETMPPADSFDIVVCNPPYFAPDTGKTCPHPARLTARHEGVGCTLEQVCAAGARLLKYGGCMSICHRPERLVDLLVELRRHGLEPKRLELKQNGKAAPWLVLVEAKKGGAPAVQITVSNG